MTMLQDPIGSNVAQCGRAMWHDRATLVVRDLIVTPAVTLAGGEIIIFHLRALKKWIWGF